MWWANTWFAAILGGFGVWGLWIFRRVPFGRAAASALFFFPLPYYVIQFDPRYAYPVEWLLALFAGFVTWRLLLWARHCFINGGLDNGRGIHGEKNFHA